MGVSYLILFFVVEITRDSFDVVEKHISFAVSAVGSAGGRTYGALC